MQHEEHVDYEREIAALLADLSDAQDELLGVLKEKRELLAAGDLPSLAAIEEREAAVGAKLEKCQARREKLLADAAARGFAAASVEQLSAAISSGKRSPLALKVREASARMRMVQNQALTNWVIAQRTLLHLSQLLAIMAAGGRLTPTYGGPASFHSRGAIVDQEA
jgi:hypothetical protein